MNKLYDAMEANIKLYNQERQVIYNRYLAEDERIQNGLKAVAKHHCCTSKTELEDAMLLDPNPYSTFSLEEEVKE